ncbi:baseplate J/gp47 family protein [Moorena producens JHB]|uniref:Baseplate J/gp47 family protein n=1 Tax=Moorena producens (strain JHB) TaxID=1454205 RepID=A0A1D9FUP1_MOOP1|nr:baseplate J/gp47 family protein [Moorena producens]AOY79035.1 baseplate J/gp47 family protein [Moorena producens JHB]
MNTNNKIIHHIFRDGVSQRGRLLRELEPDYVSVDERDVSDLLTFVQKYATKLNYYDESNRINGDWSSFFGGDVEQMLAYIKNPESFADDPSTQRQLAQPHLVLLFTFLQLLRYPQQQFKALTQRYLDFYYKEVLQLRTKEEVPDKVNVIFELAQGEEAHLINKGTWLSAGQDNQGVNINYATDEDIVVNQAQVASIKTLFIEKNSIGLEEIHNQDNKSDQSFENMLRWAVGRPNQGDQLPDFYGETVDIHYLKENIYQAIQDNQPTDDNITSYITEQLFFLNTEDFKYCFDIHDRQINKAQADKEEPTELEWNEVYKILEKAYRKKITMGRRNALKEKREQEEREQLAFKSMMELALGSPNPGDPLPKMPNGYTTLQEIFFHLDQELVIRYVKKELYLSVADFRKIMEIQATTENPDWEEVYRLVEKAQTKKRNFTYPPIGKTEIKNIHGSSLVDAEEGQATISQRFKTFGNITKTSQNSIGFAVTSPVLLLQEGTRTITLTFTGEERTLNRDKFQAILSSENGPFEIYLSSEAQWIQPESFEYEIGVFIVEDPLVSYSSTELSLSSTASDNDNLTSVSFREGSEHTFSASNVKQLLVWNDGKIFQITGLVNNNEANIQQIGIGNFPQDAVSTDQINLYRDSAIYLNSFKFQLKLDSTLPAILPPKPDESTFFLDTPYPVVKILLKEISPSENTQETLIYYEQFKSVRLEKVKIQVKVENSQDVQLRNDNSVLNPKTPFQPFGNNPKVGSGFYFANREISTKKLDSIAINIEWMGLPQDFATHYQAYNSTEVIPKAITNDSFKASLKLFNNRSRVVIESSQSIFTQEDNTLSNKIHLNYQIPGYSLDTSSYETDTDDPFEQSRYFQLELASPDFAFAHDLYPVVLNKVALSTNDDLKSLTVYPPYTPEVKAISLDYTASEEIDLKNPPNQPHSSQIFQLHPFGYADIQTLNQDNQYYLLPNYHEEGSLYIGIRNLQPPQNISILFQMIPGSGNGELTPPQIHWSYLSGNSWQEFKNTEMLSDSTNGLVDSGIIRLSIPEGATSQHNLLPSGLHWLRATVTENAAAIPDTLDIKTQAVRATFVNQGNAADHLSKPLPANSIQGFVTRDPAINTVQQPYSSFGGKPKEDNRAFTMRVSERLRHKQRAITAWDYERLVLEHFPQIYKVKCITSAAGNHNPGDAKVTVVVIPDVANTAPFFPLEPKAPSYLLKEIQVYLQNYTSPFVQIVVKNPRYKPIQYKVGIRFLAGSDQGYYLNQLNEDIKRFLSPWAYEAQAYITFGSSIHNSSVIHFIEKRSYVDYVGYLKLIEQVPIKAGSQGKSDIYYRVIPSNLAQVQHPDSILVSAPQHIIYLMGTENSYDEEDFEGIGYMRIFNEDFVVS